MDLSNYVILDATIGNETVAPVNNEAQDVAAETLAASGAGANAAESQAQESGFSSPFAVMILYVVALVGLFYFFAIRPQKKREKELKNIQNSVSPGDWVMTSSGFYGKIVDIADQVFVVEFGTNKGVRIPIRKSEIIGNKEPNLSISSESSDPEEKSKK